MVANYQSPFGVSDLVAGSLGLRAGVSVEGVEAACVRAFGVPEAVLLPSARAGIAGGTTLLAVPYWHPALAFALVAAGAGFAAPAVVWLLEEMRREALRLGQEFRSRG